MREVEHVFAAIAVLAMSAHSAVAQAADAVNLIDLALAACSLVSGLYAAALLWRAR